jgi:hypothetical protein
MVDASLRAVILRQLKELNTELKIRTVHHSRPDDAYHASEYIRYSIAAR